MLRKETTQRKARKINNEATEQRINDAKLSREEMMQNPANQRSNNKATV